MFVSQEHKINMQLDKYASTQINNCSKPGSMLALPAQRTTYKVAARSVVKGGKSCKLQIPDCRY